MIISDIEMVEYSEARPLVSRAVRIVSLSVSTLSRTPDLFVSEPFRVPNAGNGRVDLVGNEPMLIASTADLSGREYASILPALERKRLFALEC